MQASAVLSARVQVIEVDRALFYFDGELYEFERINYDDDEDL